MNFVELKVSCSQELGEILIAELSLLNFDSFEEIDGGIVAACDESAWEEDVVKDLMDRYQVKFSFTISPQINWNEEWEKYYDPVLISDQIFIGADFHKKPSGFAHYLRINPKMSFGTGHHATTSQVLEAQLSVDHQGKKVLDVGCGTGVLSILAHQLEASKIVAIDIDEWCYENSRENFTLNQCENIDLRLSGIEGVPESETFDIILANINRNVLLDQMADYVIRLNSGGILLMSGFYQEDIEVLMAEASKHNLSLVRTESKDNWAILVTKKGDS